MKECAKNVKIGAGLDLCTVNIVTQTTY